MPSLSVLRQSAAELLALVAIDLFPGALLVQSASTELDFYCEISATQPIDEYALPLLEEKMRAFAKQNLEVKALDMMRESAANYLDYKGQLLRAEEVRQAKENIVSLIQIADFCDYCPLPYIEHTKEVEFFKLYKIEAGTHHLRGDETISVKRIHGLVAKDKPSLKQAVKALKNGGKSDHRLFLKEMNLCSPNSELSDLTWTSESSGMATIKRSLIQWWEEEHKRQQFEVVSTPSFVKEALIEKAGMADSSSPYFKIEGVSYGIGSTLTPAHMSLFKKDTRSFREIPIRSAECAPLVFRHLAGKLWGLFDSRLVSADFAYIFCGLEHLQEEIISSLQFIDKIIKLFGFECHWHFDDCWQKNTSVNNRLEKAVHCIHAALQKCGFAFERDQVNPALAGLTVEARLVDQFGREWAGPTVSVDLSTPQRFGLGYHEVDGKLRVPFMVVRSIFGSIERFVALLLEHTSGLLPLWLAPQQVKIIPVSERYDAYARKVCQTMSSSGYRVNVDYGHELIGKKIAKTKNEKVPYLVILGEKEENEDLITLHSGGCEEHQQIITIEAFLNLMHDEVSLKRPRANPRAH